MRILILFFLISCIYSDKLLGRWQDAPLDNFNQLKNILKVGLDKLFLSEVFYVHEIYNYQIQQISQGKLHRLTFKTLYNKKKEGEKFDSALMVFDLIESSKAKDVWDLTRSFIIQNYGDFKHIQDEDLNKFIIQHLAQNNCKLDRVIGIYHHRDQRFQDDNIYAIILNAEKSIQNKNLRFEIWVTRGTGGEFEILFERENQFKGTNELPTTKEVTGPCEELASFYLCAARSDCSKKNYQMYGKCGAKSGSKNGEL